MSTGPGDSTDPGAGLSPAARIVKRYANRKFYDAVERQFTSLAHIQDLLRAGVEVRVVDHDTGKDLTADILEKTLRAARGNQEVTGLQVLSNLVRAPQRLTQALLEEDATAVELRELRAQIEHLTRVVIELVDRNRSLEAAVDRLGPQASPTG